MFLCALCGLSLFWDWPSRALRVCSRVVDGGESRWWQGRVISAWMGLGVVEVASTNIVVKPEWGIKEAMPEEMRSSWVNLSQLELRSKLGKGSIQCLNCTTSPLYTPPIPHPGLSYLVFILLHELHTTKSQHVASSEAMPVSTPPLIIYLPISSPVVQMDGNWGRRGTFFLQSGLSSSLELISTWIKHFFKAPEGGCMTFASLQFLDCMPCQVSQHMDMLLKGFPFLLMSPRLLLPFLNILPRRQAFPCQLILGK